MEGDERASLQRIAQMIQHLKDDFDDLSPREIAARVREIYEAIIDAADQGYDAWPLEEALDELFTRTIGISDGCDDYSVLRVVDGSFALFIEVAPHEVYVDVIFDNDIKLETAKRLSHYIVNHDFDYFYPRR